MNIFRVMLSGLLVSMSGGANAALTMNWESPLNNQVISGIQQFRGFAYSTTTMQSLLVKLIVTSPFTATIDVPWGSARSDVGASNPQLNSGFGVTVNAGNFPTGGAATITLEIREPGGAGACVAPTCVSETRTFTIVKPGGRIGEANNVFAYLSDLDLAGATIIRDGDDITVAPVNAVDSHTGEIRPSTIRLQWIKTTQSFGVVGAASGNSFAGVQSIFTSRCAIPNCHGVVGVHLGLNLEPGRAFKNLITQSAEDASRLRVNPGNATASYLFQKIIANGNIAPDTLRMPQGCSGSSCLSDVEINTIKNWIDEGAPPPQ